MSVFSSCLLFFSQDNGIPLILWSSVPSPNRPGDCLNRAKEAALGFQSQYPDVVDRGTFDYSERWFLTSFPGRDVTTAYFGDITRVGDFVSIANHLWRIHLQLTVNVKDWNPSHDALNEFGVDLVQSFLRRLPRQEDNLRKQLKRLGMSRDSIDLWLTGE